MRPGLILILCASIFIFYLSEVESVRCYSCGQYNGIPCSAIRRSTDRDRYMVDCPEGWCAQLSYDPDELKDILRANTTRLRSKRSKKKIGKKVTKKVTKVIVGKKHRRDDHVFDDDDDFITWRGCPRKLGLQVPDKEAEDCFVGKYPLAVSSNLTVTIDSAACFCKTYLCNGGETITSGIAHTVAAVLIFLFVKVVY